VQALIPPVPDTAEKRYIVATAIRAARLHKLKTPVDFETL